MKKRLASRPFFLFLLPVFFVLHGYLPHVRLIRWTDGLLLLGEYFLGTLLLYFIFRRLLKDRLRGALIAFVCLLFFLFFGDIRDFLLRKHLFIYHYSLLVPLFGLLIIGLARYSAKKPPDARIILFLNLLLGLSILSDVLLAAPGVAGKDSRQITAGAMLPVSPARCDSCPHPDIYLLVFDEYAGSRTLQRTFHYDNRGLDSFLHSEGFHILLDSRSNYSATPFSMASLLNLSYLHGIAHPRALEPDDYNNILRPLEKNQATRFLSGAGYSIVNFSPFDLAGHRATAHVPFFASGTVLITHNSLPDCVIRDMLQTGMKGKWLAKALPSVDFVQDLSTRVSRVNELFIDGTLRVSATPDGSPRFVYTHLMMPHAPFAFDSGMHRRDSPEVNSLSPVLAGYLGYIPYTNSRIRQLVSAIKKNTGGKAVILFLSDHGFRSLPGETPDSVYFRNQNAVYFPGGDYSGFYDSMSNVNQFRVVFNKLFRLDLPLLPDSTVLLLDKTN